MSRSRLAIILRNLIKRMQNPATRLRLLMFLFSLCLAILCANGCGDALSSNESTNQATKDQSGTHRYVTWDRFEVDRLMSAWLIKRFIDPNAEFMLVAFGEIIEEDVGTPFDVPGADWTRTPQSSTSGVLRHRIAMKDERLDWMLALVHDLELSAWRLDPDASAFTLQNEMHSLYIRFPAKQRFEAVFDYLDQVYEQGELISNITEPSSET